jgi:hypothetical protein
MPGLKRVQTVLKKLRYFIKRMNQIRWEGGKEDNRMLICTENWALLHNFLCMRINEVKLFSKFADTECSNYYDIK